MQSFDLSLCTPYSLSACLYVTMQSVGLSACTPHSLSTSLCVYHVACRPVFCVHRAISGPLPPACLSFCLPASMSAYLPFYFLMCCSSATLPDKLQFIGLSVLGVSIEMACQPVTSLPAFILPFCRSARLFSCQVAYLPVRFPASLHRTTCLSFCVAFVLACPPFCRPLCLSA
jgi:hypothetical protein